YIYIHIHTHTYTQFHLYTHTHTHATEFNYISILPVHLQGPTNTCYLNPPNAAFCDGVAADLYCCRTQSKAVTLVGRCLLLLQWDEKMLQVVGLLIHKPVTWQY
ncbi:unnamed protein product, partial [Staurois parvus]